MSRPDGTPRRYFWGNTLKQALTSAARYHQISPEEIAYRPVEKRHGFVKHPRRFLIEVDPETPRRAAGAAPPALPSAPAEAARPPAARAIEPASRPERSSAPAPRPERRPERSEERPRRAPDRPPTPFEPPSPPDEEAALAASVAMARLLRFAGLELDVAVERQPERLEILLSGADEERLRTLGVIFLDHLAQLVPRLVKALSGKQVLARVDGAGLRTSREGELQDLAREAAARVLATGEPVFLDPLPAGERRIVHMTLADEPRLTTESLGQGIEKRLRIALADAPR